MAREKILLVFEKDGKILRHKWTLKTGLRGIRAAKKVRKLQRVWGDPTEIIGDGNIACLLRKEYKLYSWDKENYEGVPMKNILVAGAEITGVPVRKLKRGFNAVKKKVEKRLER